MEVVYHVHCPCRYGRLLRSASQETDTTKQNYHLFDVHANAQRPLQLSATLLNLLQKKNIRKEGIMS